MKTNRTNEAAGYTKMPFSRGSEFRFRTHPVPTDLRAGAQIVKSWTFCGTVKPNILLILDNSGSMNELAYKEVLGRRCARDENTLRTEERQRDLV